MKSIGTGHTPLRGVRVRLDEPNANDPVNRSPGQKIMTQLKLPLADQTESRAERLARILAGRAEGSRAVAMTFTPQAELQASQLAKATDHALKATATRRTA